MTKKLLALPLLLLLLVAGLWWLLSGDDEGRGTGRGASVAPEPPTAVDTRPTEDAPTVELAAPEAPRAASTPAKRVEAPAFTAAPIEADYTGFDTGDARWVDVTVAFPPGTPVESDLRLILLATEGDELVEAGDVSRSLDLSDAFLDELDDEVLVARRSVGTAPVRMPLPADATSIAFLLQSRFLYLETVIVQSQAVGTTHRLEPELGAYVSGSLVIPRSALDLGLSFEQLEVELSGRATEKGFRGWSDQEEREVRLREDFTFEARALSAERTYALAVKCEELVDHLDLSLKFDPGETRVLEIPLKVGATIRGRITGSGRPLGAARVSLQGNLAGMMALRGGNEESVEDDGTYELLGVTPGKLKVAVECDGWVAPEPRSLEVADGQVLVGVDFDLARGSLLAGRVLWPDGSAAAGVAVKASRQAQFGWDEEQGSTETDDEGGFELSGFGEEALSLVAKGQPSRALCEQLGIPFEAGGAQALASPLVQLAELGYVDHTEEHTPAPAQEGPTWMARSQGVTPGTRDIVLTLTPPVLVPGHVVDQNGEPVEAFSISVLKPQESRFGSWRANEQVFSDPEGAFQVALPHDGDWALTAKATGHDDSEPQTIGLPYQGPPLAFTLRQNAGVSGHVVDPSGAPVEGAEVSVRRGDPGERLEFQFGGGEDVTTDEEGAFEFEGVSTTGATLVATHEDWARSEPFLVDVVAGGTLEGIVLTLRVGARITGEVYAEDGEPMVGRKVMAGLAGSNFGPFGGEGNDTETDAAGRFVLERVDPGKITVTATPTEEEMMEAMTGSEEEGQAAMLNLMGSILTQTVEVPDGGEAHVVLGAEPKRPVRIYGKVLDAGAPVGEASIFVVSEGSSLFQGMKVAQVAGGAYEVTVDRPGDYTLNVNLQGFQGGMGISFNCEVPDADELELDLVLPVGRITGRVVGPAGEAVEGISMRIETGGGFMGLEDLDQSKNAVSAADGGFAFERLRAGTYSISVGSGANFFGNSNKTYGGKVVADLVVQEGKALEGLEIRLERSGKLSGLVKDKQGKPVSGAAIFARDPAGRVLTGITDAVSDAGGRFVYDGLPPGRVTVFARSDTHASDDSGPLVIAAGQTTEVELILDVGTFVKVSLLEDGEPVRARLQVLDEDGRQVNGMTSTMQLQSMLMEGFSSRERRVGPLPPGTYTLVATAPSGEDAKKTVTIQAGQKERAVKLRLR